MYWNNGTVIHFTYYTIGKDLNIFLLFIKVQVYSGVMFRFITKSVYVNTATLSDILNYVKWIRFTPMPPSLSQNIPFLVIK